MAFKKLDDGSEGFLDENGQEIKLNPGSAEDYKAPLYDSDIPDDIGFPGVAPHSSDEFAAPGSKTAILNKLKPDDQVVKPAQPQQPLASTPLGEPDSSGDDLKAAQAERDRVLNMTNVQGGVNEILSGIAARSGGRLSPESAALNNIRTQSGLPIQKIQEKLQQQDELMKQQGNKLTLQEAKDARDPASHASQSARAQLFEVLPDAANDPVYASMSAAEIKANFPMLQLGENIKSREQIAEDNREARKEMANARRDATQIALEGKQSDVNDKQLQKLSDAINPAKASSRSPFGRAQIRNDAAEQIEKLVNGVPGMNLDSRQMQELATSLDALLKNGASTITGTKELVPHNFQSSAAKMVEWITSNPHGANQQKFVQRMMDTVTREHQLAQEQIKRYQMGAIPAFTNLKKRNPDDYKAVLQGQGLDPDEDTARVANALNPQESSQIDVKTMPDGRKFEVDHATKKVLREIK